MARKKKSVGDLVEELDAMGQDSEVKGSKWVIEKGKEDEKEQKEQEARELQKLHDSRKRVFTYRDALAEAMARKMVEYDIPKGFAWKLETPRQEIILIVGDPRGNMYARGLKPCGEPKYDLNAIDRMLWRGLNIMDKLEEHYERKPLAA